MPVKRHDQPTMTPAASGDNFGETSKEIKGLQKENEYLKVMNYPTK